VRTDFGSREELMRQAREDGVSDTAVDAALRTRDRLGFGGEGKRGMYLCHTFCELGATPLDDVLGQLEEFLVAHPGEVLVVINQDYIKPSDFVAAVEEAALRSMVDSGKRIVFLAENHAGGAPWYRLAYDKLTEETPYTFKPGVLTNPKKVAQTCRPNRGPRQGAPLFLLNHWVSTDPIPLPSDAAKVNAEDVLLGRARECERIRGELPNLVAVNFYARGDVFRVVDRLNGVGTLPD
jgi:hypothetical protein